MHIATKFLFLIFFYSTCIWSHHCYFIPPDDWKEMDLKLFLDTRPTVVFVGNSSHSIPPTLNLSIEPVEEINLSQYVTIVKNIYKNRSHFQWNDLGRFKEGHLISIESEVGEASLSMFQFIALYDQHAYVLTLSSPKEQFSKYRELFKDVIESLVFTSNLFHTPLLIQKREKLNSFLEKIRSEFQRIVQGATSKEEVFFSREFQKKSWKPLKKYLALNFPEMGRYWQSLVLREIQLYLEVPCS